VANINAVHSVGHSLITYLKNSFPASIHTKQQCEFLLLSSGEMASTAEIGTAISLFLFRVTVNEHLRNAKRANDPAGSHVPLSLDLHYLLSVWADNAMDEHVLLAWALDELHRHPVLDVSALSPEAEWTTGDFVQLIPAELSTEDLMRIWDALDPSYRLSVSYIARVVRIGGEPAKAGPSVASRFGYAANAEEAP
jgi:hypothetical protein